MATLGSVQNQADKMGQFKQMATGLGYDPQEVESFSRLAEMGEGIRTRREDEIRRKELADYQAKLNIQANAPYNPDTDPVLQRELYLKKNSGSQSLDELAKTRQALKDAGLDTSLVDKQIQGLGVDTGKKVVSEGDKQGIGLVDEILKRDTNPLTGALQLGNTKGIFGFNPMEAFNKTFRPGIETTKAKVEQLKGLLQLAQSGKLKGTGQISDKEREMLAKASTSLNYNMSDADFRKELENIRGILSGEAKSSGTAEDLINSYWK